VFGNKDSKQEYPISQAEKDGFVLVKHYSNHTNSNDINTESVNYQFYAPEVFEELTREDEATAKVNQLHGFGGQKYVVLNEPETKQE
jgi:hypothetical protein